MTKHILFLGCSNLADDQQKPNKEQIWKDIIFGEDVNIKNLSWWGVGNQFIAGNCCLSTKRCLSKRLTQF